MWSLGCVIAELFLGWPLYPGASEYDQVSNKIWFDLIESVLCKKNQLDLHNSIGKARCEK